MAKEMILKNYRIMDGVLSQVKGLMFEKGVETPLLFVFPKEVAHSFHSLFCPDFDIVFLDGKKEVVHSEEIRGPKLIKPVKKYMYVVEAPLGFIRKNKIRNRTRIKF